MWELCFDCILPENYKSFRNNSQTEWDVRLIHDCSRPDSTAVNYVVGHFEKQRFQTIDDAAKLVSKYYYLSKVDLKSAYRSARISAISQEVTGFQ